MQVKTQLDDLQDYLNDASNLPGGHAEKLFLPETAEEIAEVLREANKNGTSVTVSGARTGTVGGAIPFGGVIVSLEKFNKLRIDKVSRTAVAGSGVLLGDLQRAVENEGLFYPPDPTEWSCQIGGTVATNASGARSFKYGSTRRYVRRIEVVLANGEILEIERNCEIRSNLPEHSLGRLPQLTYDRPHVRKNVSGYYHREPLDLIDLFIGSEGTLGVITEVELALLPKPEGFFSGIVFFVNDTDLLSFVDEARDLSISNFGSEVSDGINATLIEYFDDRALRFIAEKFPDTPADMAGAIFFEQETTAENEDSLLESWNELFERHRADLGRSWFTTNEQDREKMRAFRHALPVSVNERVVKSKQRKIGTDMAVPDENFASFLRYYKQTLGASGLDYVIFGHIGDCHLHANMLPKNELEAEKARHIYGRCVAQAIMLGGTVSAEHGIGKLKRQYLAAMMGERYLNEMAELKKAFDPKCILGRGNVFNESYL